jgi:integrase
MIPRLTALLSEAVRERPNLSEQSERILSCHPNSVYKQINSVCAANSLPLIGVHGLRHSFASLAHSLGVPEAECMALGGWQDPQTMRKIYTHLDNAARLKASNAIAAFYQNTNAKR